MTTLFRSPHMSWSHGYDMIHPHCTLWELYVSFCHTYIILHIHIAYLKKNTNINRDVLRLSPLGHANWSWAPWAPWAAGSDWVTTKKPSRYRASKQNQRKQLPTCIQHVWNAHVTHVTHVIVGNVGGVLGQSMRQTSCSHQSFLDVICLSRKMPKVLSNGSNMPKQHVDTHVYTNICCNSIHLYTYQIFTAISNWVLRKKSYLYHLNPSFTCGSSEPLWNQPQTLSPGGCYVCLRARGGLTARERIRYTNLTYGTLPHRLSLAQFLQTKSMRQNKFGYRLYSFPLRL